jgi:hypothetical protein
VNILNRNISVTPTGVRVEVDNNPSNHLPEDFNRSYLPGNPLWDFLQGLARRELKGLSDVKGKKLVRVDVRKYTSQFSWQ